MNRFIIAALAVLSLFSGSTATAQCPSEFPGVWPAVTSCPNNGTRRIACMISCQNGHVNSWNNVVKPLIEQKCDFESGLASFLRMQGLVQGALTELEYELIRLEVLCFTYTPACAWADTVRTGIAAANEFLDSLQDSIDDYNTWIADLVGDIYSAKAYIDQWYVDCMDTCCENSPSAEPKAMLVSMVVACDTQYPGSPPIPVLGAGLCYDTACVNAAKAAHQSTWNTTIKDGRDFVCDLQDSADYWHGQAFYFANLAAQMIPLCYAGDDEACRLMGHYQAEEQEAIDQADAFEILVVTYTNSLDVDLLNLNAGFLTAILSCSYPCN
jgi:hypothetical protein